VREGALRVPARAPEGRLIRELLDELAAKTPAPGGGAAAAWAVGIAAALVEMASRFGDLPHDPAAGLRARAVELAEIELHAYEPVLEAQRSGDAARVAEALSRAADSPLAIARLAAEVAELGASAAQAGKEAVKGDALVGVVLAEACCRAAGRLVRINLASMPGDPRLAELEELERRASAAVR
jgi:methenyltetrahydrofolate cyclohydrolase